MGLNFFDRLGVDDNGFLIWDNCYLQTINPLENTVLRDNFFDILGVDGNGQVSWRGEALSLDGGSGECMELKDNFFDNLDCDDKNIFWRGVPIVMASKPNVVKKNFNFLSLGIN